MLPQLGAGAEAFAVLPDFAARDPRVVEATVDLSSGARPETGVVVIGLNGRRDDAGPDRVAILDGRTGAPLAAAAIPAELPARVTLEPLPVGEHHAVLFRSGQSPRFGYTQRQAFVLRGGTAPDQPRAELALDVSTSSATVRLEATSVPADRPWTMIAARLVRAEDRRWCPQPAEGFAPSFAPGSTVVELRFDGLGAGRYELLVDGFELEGADGAATGDRREPQGAGIIELPAEQPTVLRGRPR